MTILSQPVKNVEQRIYAHAAQKGGMGVDANVAAASPKPFVATKQKNNKI